MVEKAVVHELDSVLIDIPGKLHTVTASKDNHVATDMDSVLEGASLILNRFSAVSLLFKELLICSLRFPNTCLFFPPKYFHT